MSEQAAEMTYFWIVFEAEPYLNQSVIYYV